MHSTEGRSNGNERVHVKERAKGASGRGGRKAMSETSSWKKVTKELMNNLFLSARGRRDDSVLCARV